MRNFSAVLLSRALDPLAALLSSPRGRHASAAGRRRRRSTRVRRYAPVPASGAAPTQVSRASERSEPPETPVPAPRLATPSEHVPAEDTALVRSYFVSHERERDLTRAQARATARLHDWTTRSAAPTGDLLAATAPAPRAPREWDELAALTRVWITQQERRREVPA